MWGGRTLGRQVPVGRLLQRYVGFALFFCFSTLCLFPGGAFLGSLVGGGAGRRILICSKDRNKKGFRGVDRKKRAKVRVVIGKSCIGAPA